MEKLKPLAPAPLDVVPASEVGDSIAQAQDALRELEREHAEVSAAASHAERRASEDYTDPELHDWAAKQLARFGDQLRAEHAIEMERLIGDAHERAREVVQRAQIEADVILTYANVVDPPPEQADESWARVLWRAPGGAVVDITPSPAPVVTEHPGEPEPEPEAAPEPEPQPTVATAIARAPDGEPTIELEPVVLPPAAVSDPTLVVTPPAEALWAKPADAPAPEPVAAAVADEPVAVEPVADEAAAVEPVAVEPAAAEPVAVAKPVEDAPVDAFSELAAADRAAQASASGGEAATDQALATAPKESAHVDPASAADDAFWQDKEQPRKRKLLRALPMFAIIQVVAVIIILLVVLLRIG